MTEPAAASQEEDAARIHVPERTVPGSDPELREVDQRAPAQATEEVLVLDFGGQYSQLIARRIRECGVFSELLPHDIPLGRIRERGPRGSRRRTSSGGTVCGSSSLKTPHSRTRRAMSCEYWPPKSRTSTSSCRTAPASAAAPRG
jgi:hypothetical protein